MLHDSPHDALMRAVPYGMYDVSSKCGAVYVGSSADTPEFAVTAGGKRREDNAFPPPKSSSSWRMLEAVMAVGLAADTAAIARAAQ